MSKLNIQVLKEIVNNLDQQIENYNHFIETGTYVGETIINLQPYFKQLSTIELSLDLFLHFNNTKQNVKLNNVQNYLGDSIVVLPGLLMISGADNVIFWLDGHYSGHTWAGETALGIKECPLLEECTYIDNFCKSKKCIILIDDFGLFEKKENFDWSDISFNKICKIFKNYTVKKTQKFSSLGNPSYWSGDIFALSLESKN